MRLRDVQIPAIAGISLFIIFTIINLSNNNKITAIADCEDIQMFLLQGSGQNNKNSNEMNTLKNEVEKQISSVEYITLSYPLEYPAVLINPLDEDASSDTKYIAAEAILTQGMWGVYNDSVNSGASSLIDKLEKIYLQCPNSHLVLAGYSQGADVIGRAIENLEDKITQKIVYVALFGDPKANMNPNNGLNPFDVPWKRGSTLLWSDGILGGRNPYTKDVLKLSTGSWCDYLDGICKGNILTLSSGAHGKYGDKYAASAVKEITSAVLKIKPELKVLNPTCGATKQDIVLAVNMSDAVRSDLLFLSEAGIKKTVEGVFKAGCDVRAGVVVFGKDGVDPVQPVIDFTSNPAELAGTLRAYKTPPPSSLVDIDKADVTDGISTALDFSWREDAGKAIIVMSDAPGNEYRENWAGLDTDHLMATPAMQNIIKKSREKGGVEIHAAQIVHTSGYSYSYLPTTTSFYRYMDRLVKMTAGTFAISNRCDHCSWLDMVLDYQPVLSRKPTVSVPTIRVRQGQKIELQAKDISAGVIEAEGKSPNYPFSYTWYTDCSNLSRPTHHDKAITFEADVVGSCQGAVLARGHSWGYCNVCYESDPYGARQVTPFMIEIIPADYLDPPVPGAVQNLVKERLWNDNILRVSWDPPSNADEVGEIAYVIKDGDGNILGATRSTKLHITDVKDSENPIVLINAASGHGAGSGVSSAEAKDMSSPRPVPSTDQSSQTAPSSSVTQAEQTYGITAIQAAQAPGNQSGIIPIAATNIESPVLGSQTTALLNPRVSGHSEVHDQPKNSWWTTLTIMALPLAVAVALGFVVKSGMLLRLKK